jgi:hypothetical protein
MKITARLTKVFIIFALAQPISVLYPTFCWPTDDEALKIAKRIDTLYRSKSSYSDNRNREYIFAYPGPAQRSRRRHAAYRQ